METAEQVAVVVARHLSNELGPVGGGARGGRIQCALVVVTKTLVAGTKAPAENGLDVDFRLERRDALAHALVLRHDMP